MLPMVEFAKDTPESCAGGMPFIPFPTLTNELCGDSAERESLPPISPGAEETPLIPCLAKWAKCR